MDGESDSSQPATPLIERLAGTEGTQVVERPGVDAPGVRRRDRVDDQLTQQSLGRGEGEVVPWPCFRAEQAPKRGLSRGSRRLRREAGLNANSFLLGEGIIFAARPVQKSCRVIVILIYG
jgi:hypothetical protein